MKSVLLIILNIEYNEFYFSFVKHLDWFRLRRNLTLTLISSEFMYQLALLLQFLFNLYLLLHSASFIANLKPYTNSHLPFINAAVYCYISRDCLLQAMQFCEFNMLKLIITYICITDERYCCCFTCFRFKVVYFLQ